MHADSRLVEPIAQETGETVMGWDVGGAHLKAARVEGNDRISGVWQEACPLWRGLEHLHAAIDRILAESTPLAWHAVTMTGEMTDLFKTRRSGVHALVDVLCQRLGSDRVRFYGGALGWLDADATRLHAEQVASANWHASAHLVATRLDDGLLVDIGSTTTDIIPIRDGGVATFSTSDSDRLVAGELVYTGVVRTPVMALAAEAPVAGRWAPLMAEHFATSADVYRVLGWLPETADQQDSADGGPKTAEASRARLARMMGRDACALPEGAWAELAAWFANAQLERISRAARQVLSRGLLEPNAPLVIAGTGAFLGERLAARLGRPVMNFSQLLTADSMSGKVDWCAPAVAVGWLLAGEKKCK
ncbi:ATP synthase subunit C [Sulfuriferula plumbiphila]|uniref:ATP synthase subunit C n=1 Tax=Sulfuriferula plumbiphila TaxID=171865 RepID=A0A512L6Y1_9PROT|nr:hydantoinase/oxoprolinase family protein [Sulfuriferula plumbiphila]BBP05168.1 ATP synthase subunit C [Sulfuriferula plumbiphila]GEP29911.1 ATP synthase subunit C [Sulfuriferula plumbiphila]